MKMDFFTSPTKRLWARLTGCDTAGLSTSSSDSSLICKYDQENDCLLARFGVPQEADNIVVEPGVAVRISRTTFQPIAIEVTDCAAKFRKDPSAITTPFARALLAQYGARALQQLAAARGRRTTLESALRTR